MSIMGQAMLSGLLCGKAHTMKDEHPIVLNVTHAQPEGFAVLLNENSDGQWYTVEIREMEGAPE